MHASKSGNHMRFFGIRFSFAPESAFKHQKHVKETLEVSRTTALISEAVLTG